MIVKRIDIDGFRNLLDCQLQFCSTKNLIYGLNGAGKTSVLEAIFLPGFGRSFLNVKKSEILNYNSKEFKLKMELERSSGKSEITAFFGQKKFILLLNDKKSNIQEVNQIFYPVFFSSSNYNLYIESRPYIRKMLDRFIFGVNPLYIHYILSYNKALKQKNYLLKKGKDLSELTGWNKVMCEMGAKIVRNRNTFVGKLNDQMESLFKEQLRINYHPSTMAEGEITPAVFWQDINRMKEREIRVRKSLIGPHLDQYEIILDGKNLKLYSSGEKKINLLMIYIAFIEFFRKVRAEYPVFLIDDYDTAIDRLNVDFLLTHYPQMQVIATSVQKNDRFDHLIALSGKPKEN